MLIKKPRTIKNMLRFNGFLVERVEIESVDSLIPLLGDKLQATSEECFREVVFAALLSLRSFSRGTNRAKSLGGEFILRIAGSKQISESIKKKGLKVGFNYLVFFGDKKEFMNILQKADLKTVELKKCKDAEIKKKFEKSAILEAF